MLKYICLPQNTSHKVQKVRKAVSVGLTHYRTRVKCMYTCKRWKMLFNSILCITSKIITKLIVYTLNEVYGGCVQPCEWVSYVMVAMVWRNQGAKILGCDEVDGEKVSAGHTVESAWHEGCGMESWMVSVLKVCMAGNNTHIKNTRHTDQQKYHNHK